MCQADRDFKRYLKQAKKIESDMTKGHRHGDIENPNGGDIHSDGGGESVCRGLKKNNFFHLHLPFFNV